MPKSPFWIALLSALLFGAATPFSKILLAHLTPFQLAGLLYLGAAVGVLGIILRTRTFLVPWRMDRKNQLRLLGAVTFGGVLGPLALLGGLNLASAASVSMWLNFGIGCICVYVAQFGDGGNRYSGAFGVQRPPDA